MQNVPMHRDGGNFDRGDGSKTEDDGNFTLLTAADLARAIFCLHTILIVKSDIATAAPKLTAGNRNTISRKACSCCQILDCLEFGSRT